MNAGVLWPIAKDDNGEYVAIADARRGNRYFCPECGGYMIARLGRIRRHHFAHYSGVAASCGGESACHAMAKHLLARHLSQIGEIRYSSRCPQCGQEAFAVRKGIQSVEVERSAGDRRPDLLIQLADGTAFGEVVHRHRLGEKFVDYQRKRFDLVVWFVSGYVEEVPDMVLKPWQAVGWEEALRKSGSDLFFLSGSFLDSHECDRCYQARIERERKARERRNSIRQAVRERMASRTQQGIKRWWNGRHGERLYARTRAELWAIGGRLIKHGFIQSVRKPYLFYLRLPPYGAVFVDLGGNECMPFWKGGLLYHNLSCREGDEEIIVDEVRRQLVKAGIKTEFEPDLPYDGEDYPLSVRLDKSNESLSPSEENPLVREAISRGARVVETPNPSWPESASPLGRIQRYWGDFVESCRDPEWKTDALLRGSCEPIAIEGRSLVLGFYADGFQKRELEKPDYRRTLEDKLEQMFGRRYSVRCVVIGRV